MVNRTGTRRAWENTIGKLPRGKTQPFSSKSQQLPTMLSVDYYIYPVPQISVLLHGLIQSLSETQTCCLSMYKSTIGSKSERGWHTLHFAMLQHSLVSLHLTNLSPPIYIRKHLPIRLVHTHHEGIESPRARKRDREMGFRAWKGKHPTILGQAPALGSDDSYHLL